MKFKREISKSAHMEDRFMNSFYKTGFINEDVFDRDSKDMWKAFIRLLSNSNSSSVFTSILVAYKEVPYSAKIVQDSMVLSDKKSNKNKTSDGDIFVDIKLDYYKFYECIFAKSPYMYSMNTRSNQCIKNTIDIIKRDFSESNGYTVVESSLLALYDSYSNEADQIDSIDMHEDLLVRYKDKTDTDVNRLVLMVPMLIDDSYYIIDGIRTYPIITEAYHYVTSMYGQKEFICKTNYGKKKVTNYSISLGYFDTANLEDKNGPEIFYIKLFYNKFYNPLMFLNKYEAEDLFNEIMADSSVTPRNKEILKNTYDHFISLDAIRSSTGHDKNMVSNIKVWRENDSFFDKLETEENKEEPSKSTETRDIDDVLDTDDNVSVDNETNNNDASRNNDEIDTTKFNRRMVSKNLVKSLIMGYNNVRYYSFYGHMADIYLMSTNKISNTRQGNSGKIVSNLLPRDKVIYATIRSNKDLCANYDNTNPYDVWARVSYKKYTNPTVTDLDNAKKKTSDVSKSNPDDRMRYLTEEEYTLIDPTTTKSEKTSGIASSFTLFNHKKWAFRKAEDI